MTRPSAGAGYFGLRFHHNGGRPSAIIRGAALTGLPEGGPVFTPMTDVEEM
jgi:hypothetical protein